MNFCTPTENRQDCGGSRFWISAYQTMHCANCQPPAIESQIKSEVDIAQYRQQSNSVMNVLYSNTNVLNSNTQEGEWVRAVLGPDLDATWCFAADASRAERQEIAETWRYWQRIDRRLERWRDLL